MDCHQSLIVEDQTSYLKLKEGVLDSVEMRVWTGDKGMDGERESPRMCRLIFLLGQNATSCVMLNGGVTPKLFLTRSVRQGCPLSPLLLVIVVHPLLVMFSNLATRRHIVGLHLPSGGQLVAQALADESFMFLQASKENLEWRVMTGGLPLGSTLKETRTRVRHMFLLHHSVGGQYTLGSLNVLQHV